MPTRFFHRGAFAVAIATFMLVLTLTTRAHAQDIAVRADVIYAMDGSPPIADGIVLVRDGKIAAVGPRTRVTVPDGVRLLDVAVVTPGLVDAHSVVGLAGQFNYDHDQDQLERSDPLQPELRALDALNIQERLISWVRSFGVTTVHTGHAPGELISGQTLIAKTIGNTVDDAVLVQPAMVAATLGDSAQKSGKQSPGTRGKQMAMLRAELIKAQEYRTKLAAAEDDKKPARDLGLEMLVRVLDGEVPMLVNAHREQDLSNALRLAREFEIRIVLDGAAEAYRITDEILEAGVPVFVHPTMQRANRETKNLTMENAARLKAAGIPIALQSEYESYVPKTRCVLFEAAIAAANGLSFQDALASITIDAARILGIADRVGSIEVGKDGDLALYDGDPFEFTSHCVGTIIEGRIVSDVVR